MCCFCGDGVKSDDEDMIGVVQTDPKEGGFVQQWFAHWNCFVNALHPNARIFKPDDEDDEWDVNE
jgi:hypothetical protein